MFEKTFTIKKKEEGTRIDALCAQRVPDISRSQFSKLGKFFKQEIKGKKTIELQKQSKYLVKYKEVWRVQYEERETTDTLKPWDYPLKVIQDSKTWVAIEKPSGISVHPSQTDPTQRTIVNALQHQFKNLSENFDEIDGQKVARPGLVHRLDKYTSGVLLIAKTTKTHKYLQDHWKEVDKIYHALVHGDTPKKGKIEAGIIRDPVNRQRMTVLKSEKAKDAVTHFETLDIQHNKSLLKLRIPTGRTHQIRVHLSSIGFPILGDEKYGGPKAERLMLHAHSLTFPDPDNKGKMTEIFSPVPKEIALRFPGDNTI